MCPTRPQVARFDGVVGVRVAHCWRQSCVMLVASLHIEVDAEAKEQEVLQDVSHRVCLLRALPRAIDLASCRNFSLYFLTYARSLACFPPQTATAFHEAMGPADLTIQIEKSDFYATTGVNPTPSARVMLLVGQRKQAVPRPLAVVVGGPPLGAPPQPPQQQADGAAPANNAATVTEVAHNVARDDGGRQLQPIASK